MDFATSLPNALILGLALAAVAALAALLLGWLDRRGAAAAVIVGALIFAAGKVPTFALLFFFLSSHLLERAARPALRQGDLAAQEIGPRTAWQVLAAGGVPALASVGMLLGGGTAYAEAMLAAIAFSTADTWATGVGMTAHRPPRLLGFGRRITPGLSGGMSLRGTIASALGAAAAGLFAGGLEGKIGLKPVGSIALLGFAGALCDSVLGATVQTRYRCRVCGIETESRSHCDGPADRSRGVLSNSGVNLVCAVAVALVALVL
jgi:uncharacterized protein (TIGR00297 family)